MIKPLAQFLFELENSPGLSSFILSELGSHLLYCLRQEAMVAQRDKLHELPSPEIVGIPCARSRAVKAALLHGKQFFDFFSQPIVFKRRKRVHGPIADKGEIAEVLLCFGDSFVVKSYLQLSATPLFSADQVLLYFPLRGFRELDPPSGADRANWPGLVWVSAGLLLNAALITTLGFIISCTLCYVLAVQGLRRASGKASGAPKTWAMDIMTGLLISAPVFWMFTQFLAINLPGLTSTGWL